MGYEAKNTSPLLVMQYFSNDVMNKYLQENWRS